MKYILNKLFPDVDKEYIDSFTNDNKDKYSYKVFLGKVNYLNNEHTDNLKKLLIGKVKLLIYKYKFENNDINELLQNKSKNLDMVIVKCKVDEEHLPITTLYNKQSIILSQYYGSDIDKITKVIDSKCFTIQYTESSSKTSLKFSSIFGDKLTNNKKEIFDTDHILMGKVVGLYFSSSWCPPCQHFTPKLVTFYNKYHTIFNFEIVFLSSEIYQDQLNYKRYFYKMPWKGVLTKDNFNRCKKLYSKYCKTIPTLIFIDNLGNTFDIIIGYDDRDKMFSDPYSLNFVKQLYI